jgi:hypothetical protein
MLTETFDNIEKCYDRDLYETIEDAITLGLIHWEQGARYNYEKELGAKWANTF